ncbi:MAG: hypothetical protein LBG27_11680 [Spirochaetaceae bacterium]|jgi:hypothetical protein|nr:hypothetical protein [Spirochaetaceae bacterium]
MRTKKLLFVFAAVSLFQAFAACSMEFIRSAGAEAPAAGPPSGGLPDIGQTAPEEAAGYARAASVTAAFSAAASKIPAVLNAGLPVKLN